jgi:hypothetical protein
MAARLKSYLKFLYESTNHHGVHSPFVFKLVTKCLYSQKPDMARDNFGSSLNKKQIELLYRVLYYFKGGKLMVLGPDAGPVAQIFRTAGEREEKFTWFFTTMAPVPGGVNIGFVSHPEKEEALNLFEKLLPFINNDTVCVIPDIHASGEMEELWEDIQRHPKVTVTVDVYHAGLVFFRKEQREQHFKIRM